MPSHIFTRVGYWQESIASNTASAKVAAENHESADQLHAMDYLVYAYLQTAQDAKARATIDEMVQVRSTSPTAAGPFAVAASSARYVIERDDWAGATALAPAPSKFGFVDAITHFAIGLGAARTGNVALAKEKITELGKLTDALFEAKDRYWSEQVDIQRMSLMAWTALAERNRDEALDLMKKTADAEDASDKSPITPGPLAPARELLGDMLLQLGQPGEARAQYEATLKKEPNRFRATYGAAKAAAQSGDVAQAKARYAELLKIAANGDRPVLAEARQFLAAN